MSSDDEDFSDEEMEVPVVKTRAALPEAVPQRQPPKVPTSQPAPPPVSRPTPPPQRPVPPPAKAAPPATPSAPPQNPEPTPPTTATPSVPMSTPAPLSSSMSLQSGITKTKRESRVKTSKSSQQDANVALDGLRSDNDRLRGLVTSLQSRLELLEISQTKMIELNEDLQYIKEALNESSLITKKDFRGVTTIEKSTVISTLQKSVTSDASSILDLLENDKSIYMCGWMHKKGRKVRNWKHRWFVLKGSKFSYFAKEANDKTVLGEINIETCIVDELKEREESGRACMALLVEGRKLLFYAETTEDNNRWYMYLVCKNAELSYLRKSKHTAQPVNNCLLIFLEQPMVSEVHLDNSGLSIDSIVALASTVRIHSTLTTLTLRYANLDDLAVSTLCEALKVNKSVETLDLEGNSISPDGAKAIGLMLNTNKSLKHLILKENQIGDRGLQHIASALQTGSHPALETLDLTHNGIESAGAEAFAQTIGTASALPNLPELSFDDNNIGNTGAAALVNSCQNNPAVKTLKFQNNKITLDGVIAISRALQTNSTIKRIYLGSNVWTPDANKHLLDTILINRSLEFIEFSSYRLESSDLASLRLLNDCKLIRT